MKRIFRFEGVVQVLRALSLFSGIGGLDLAAEMAGIEASAFCEIEPFPVEVLTKRFPGVPIFDDVRKLKRGDIDGSIDVIHGGFPCQDLSAAGKQRGLSGERSGLWFEMLRVIHEFRPRYVLAENVRGAVNLALDTVYSNLVNEGYKVYPYVISASAVGAPHQRERLFVVGVREDVADAYRERYIHGESQLNTTEAREYAQRNIAASDTPMANPGCELRQGGSEQREMGRETSEGVASDTQFSSGTLWPTPRQFMYKDSTTDRNKGNIGEKVGGQLNPAWVEQLMNFPEGWTDLEVDEPKPWQGWPALLGQEQYPYEFPRTTTGCKDRAKRLKALGNAVVPAQAYPFFRAIAEIERSITNDCDQL